jgi:hypothetical protein
MTTVEDYVAKFEGLCGGESNLIVVLKPEKKDQAITRIIKHCIVKKTVSNYMLELEFQKLTFRLFTNGRLVFRGIKNKKELNKILANLLL